MDPRIAINHQQGEVNISIRAFKDAGKQQMLLTWIVLFTLCGAAILSQFFGDYDAGTKVFFGVYMAFWFFFEFKVIYAYRWRKMGLEHITVNQEELTLTKTIGKRGVTQQYALSDIAKVDLFKDPGSNLVKAMTTSYWNINKYRLALHLKNKQVVPFGIDLEHADAKKIRYAIGDALL